MEFVRPNTCAAFSLEAEGQERLALVIEADRTLARTALAAAKEAADPVPVPERMERHAGIEALVSRIRQAVANEHEVFVHTLVFVRPGSFPRTSSGKVQRATCRTRLLEGGLEEVYVARAVAAPDVTLQADGPVGVHRARLEENIHAIILRWICEELRQPVERIGRDTQFTSLGLDSLALSTIGAELEEIAGRRLDAALLYEYQTIRTLAAYLDGQAPATLPGPSGREERAASCPESRHRSVRLRARAPAAVGLPVRGAEGQSNGHRPTDHHLNGTARSNPAAAAERPKGFARYREALGRVERWEQAGAYPYHTAFSAQAGSWGTAGSRRFLMLGSYSYLGLLGNPEIAEASSRAARELGTGAHGVRILAGTTTAHHDLELQIASFLGAEEAVVFGSGFITNVATVSALVSEGDRVIGDAWNHASIVDGCRLSGAHFDTFPHNDLDALEQRLKQAGGAHTLVVVDAVYSMDGDIAPLPQISDLCRRYGALLMVDEAHSLGVLGETGRGIREHFGLPTDAADVWMGALSKAIPSCGGYVAASRDLVRYLRHHARGYIFSSALPAPQMAAASAALTILAREPERVAHLRRMQTRYIGALQAHGFDTLRTCTPIVPLACQTEETTLQMTWSCRESGVYVCPVFYPAVPMNSPRLRTCVLASHTEADIDLAVEALARAGQQCGLI